MLFRYRVTPVAYQRILAWLMCLLWTRRSLASSRPMNVTLITVHVGANPLYGYYLALPVFAVAVDHIRRRFPVSLGNLRYVPLYFARYDLCEPGGDHVGEFITDQYYRRPDIFDDANGTNFPVLAHADCSTQAMPLADLAREWNLPLFTSVAGNTRLVNKHRYSTTSAIASMAGSDVITALHRLFQRFRWRTVTIICDDLSDFAGLSNFYVIQCQDTLRLLAKEGYTWYSLKIDSKFNQSFHDYLTDFKDRCRIMVFLTMPAVLRQIMLAADDLRLTLGDYVFVTLQPTTRPGISPITWKSRSHSSGPHGPERPTGEFRSDDERILQAYKTLNVLTGVNPDWEDETVGNLMDEITKKKLELFGLETLSGDERNELQVCIYESTMMFATVYDENYDDVRTMSTPAFIRRTFNRTYNFAARNFTTDRNGAMVNYIVVLRLNPLKKTFSIAMIYDPVSQIFDNFDMDLWYWINRNASPPDVPPCGFANDMCDVAPRGSTALIGGVAAAAATIIAIVAVSITVMFFKRQSDLLSLWWQIEPGALTTVVQKSVLQTPDVYTALEEKIVGVKMQYRYQTVYAKVVPVFLTTPIAKSRQLRRNLYNLNNVRHDNIASLMGLSQTVRGVTLVSECTSKGTLRQLLSFGQQKMDDKLHSSLCWDLFHGLEYVQKTSVELHGNLNSFLCLVDHRFTLKIAQVGYERLEELLYAFSAVQYVRDDNLRDVLCLWKPASIVSQKDRDGRRKGKHTKEVDTFSMAMIMYEILTHKLPCNIPNFLPEVVQETLAKVMAKGNFQIQENDSAMSDSAMSAMRHLLNSCLADPSDNYPTMKTIGVALKKTITKSKPYVHQIVRDLEVHARKLEEIVDERSTRLMMEMLKADALLQELMPTSIVRRLRNKERIPPEHFDQVTLLFSDLPAFGQIVVQCSPLDTIELLNNIHSLYDELLIRFDVYKVETINDSYIIASGLPVRNGLEHAGIICSLALELLEVAKSVTNPAGADKKLQNRIGVHSGPVVAGVIGRKMPRYCLFGDTMNTCSRMESHGEEGSIHVSEATSLLIQQRDEFILVPRGGVTIKGKGLMYTYWLIMNQRANQSLNLPWIHAGALDYGKI